MSRYAEQLIARLQQARKAAKEAKAEVCRVAAIHGRCERVEDEYPKRCYLDGTNGHDDWCDACKAKLPSWQDYNKKSRAAGAALRSLLAFKPEAMLAGRAKGGGMSALKLIADERLRQISVEKWDTGHDDEHDEGQLARAAAVYALPSNVRLWNFQSGGTIVSGIWPFDDGFKPVPSDRIRELVKAGALIVAEIERLQRSDATKATP